MASINDKITKTFDTVNPNVARVNAVREAGVTTLQADNLAGWPEDTAVHFATYRLDSSGGLVDGTQTDWKGVANKATNTITNLTRLAGAEDSGSLVADVIEAMPTASWANDLAEAMLEGHNTDGSLKDKAVELTKLNGGATVGVLKTDASGNVTVGKTTADNIDFTTMPYMAKTTAGTDGQVIGGNTLATAAFRRVIASKGDIEATTNGVKIKKPGWYSVVGAASFGDAPNSNTFIRVAVKSESESGEVRLITPLERLVVGEIWRGISINMNLKLEVGDIVLLEVQNAHSANTRLSSMNEERRIYQYSLSVTMLNSD